MSQKLMENRRAFGRETIARKLKFNQDFLHSNKLSDKTPIWTKWHQDRLLSTEMGRDMSNAPNQRYLNVSDSTGIC